MYFFFNLPNSISYCYFFRLFQDESAIEKTLVRYSNQQIYLNLLEISNCSFNAPPTVANHSRKQYTGKQCALKNLNKNQTKTSSNPAQKSEMIFCMLFHSNSDAYTLSYWWRYSGAVRRCHYVSAPNVSYYCWRFRCLPVKFQNRYELIFEYSYLYFQRTFSFRIAITSMLPIVLFPLLGILVSDRFERSIM